ncbi:MAG: single-stranded DNA-binding protein [Methyloprofundus sp.]|nr:single-stranded DNA-binding protein [Methyloprofundus sp.]MDT8425738.1 single-stranded DNA-binding protein [Methyloprofundus sp.]
MSNVFSFTGTIGRDAEVRSTPNGQTVLNVTVANNVGFGDRQQTLWVRVALWGRRAEGSFPSYLKKGQQVFVSGELSQSEYQAQDGTTKTSLELNANILDLVGAKRTEPTQVAQPQQNYRQPAQPQAPQQAQPSYAQNDDYDDVPF